MAISRRTTRLWLICHASTSVLRSSAFPADEPLEPNALRKLSYVPSKLRNIDRCWTSPALRAIQTAEALQVSAAVDPLLRECDYGAWAGRTFDEVQKRDPKAVAAWLRDPSATPHGGESIAALIARVGIWLDAQRKIPGNTMALTHASVVRAAVVLALGAPAHSFWRIDVAPLSVTRLSCAGEHWTVCSLGGATTTRNSSTSNAVALSSRARPRLALP
jgi:broad specificity phosphatase PhoE